MRLGLGACGPLVAPDALLVPRPYPRERGRQLPVLEPRHRCRLRDPHPIEERAPDPLALAVAQVSELITKQGAGSQPIYLLRGPTPACLESS
jgi:hypothetical protein